MAVLTSQLIHRRGASRLDHTDGGIARRTDRMADANAALPLSSTGCYFCVTAANLRIQRGMTGWPRPGPGLFTRHQAGHLLHSPPSMRRQDATKTCPLAAASSATP